MQTLGRTDWDTCGELHRQSIEIGDHRHAVSDGDVDWHSVALARQWDAAVLGKKGLSTEDLALNEGAGDEVLERFVGKDVQGMLVAWEGSPHSAACLSELAVIAHLYAELGSSKAEPLIEQLGRYLPAEAEALHAILAWKQQKFSESGQRLVAALTGLRSNPWLLEHIRMKTFDTAISLAEADPRGRPVVEAFREPFAAAYADESRRATACVIAEGLDLAMAAQYVESFEPYVPWSKESLTYRQRIYHAAGHRLAVQADHDLEEFDPEHCHDNKTDAQAMNAGRLARQVPGGILRTVCETQPGCSRP